jgi:hypothetical protein
LLKKRLLVQERLLVQPRLQLQAMAEIGRRRADVRVPAECAMRCSLRDLIAFPRPVAGERKAGPQD